MYPNQNKQFFSQYKRFDQHHRSVKQLHTGMLARTHEANQRSIVVRRASRWFVAERRALRLSGAVITAGNSYLQLSSGTRRCPSQDVRQRWAGQGPQKLDQIQLLGARQVWDQIERPFALADFGRGRSRRSIDCIRIETHDLPQIGKPTVVHIWSGPRNLT